MASSSSGVGGVVSLSTSAVRSSIGVPSSTSVFPHPITCKLHAESKIIFIQFFMCLFF